MVAGNLGCEILDSGISADERMRLDASTGTPDEAIVVPDAALLGMRAPHYRPRGQFG
jgi:hypothetical protein